MGIGKETKNRRMEAAGTHIRSRKSSTSTILRSILVAGDASAAVPTPTAATAAAGTVTRRRFSDPLRSSSSSSLFFAPINSSIPLPPSISLSFLDLSLSCSWIARSLSLSLSFLDLLRSARLYRLVGELSSASTTPKPRTAPAPLPRGARGWRQKPQDPSRSHSPHWVISREQRANLPTTQRGHMLVELDQNYYILELPKQKKRIRRTGASMISCVVMSFT